MNRIIEEITREIEEEIIEGIKEENSTTLVLTYLKDEEIATFTFTPCSCGGYEDEFTFESTLLEGVSWEVESKEDINPLNIAKEFLLIFEIDFELIDISVFMNDEFDFDEEYFEEEDCVCPLCLAEEVVDRILNDVEEDNELFYFYDDRIMESLLKDMTYGYGFELELVPYIIELMNEYKENALSDTLDY